MKPDDFEQRLRQQPLRQVPAAWREEILSAARATARSRPSTPDPRPSWLSTLLWPNPKAWAGLAALWVLVFALHFAARDGSPAIAKQSAPLSPQVLMALREQEQLVAELIGRSEAPDADRPQPAAPRPHSHRQETFSMV